MVREELIDILGGRRFTYPYLTERSIYKTRYSSEQLEEIKAEFEKEDIYKGKTLKEYIDSIKGDMRACLFKHNIQLCEPYDVSKYELHIEILFGYHNTILVFDDDFKEIGKLSDTDKRFNYPIYETYLEVD